MIKTFSRFSFLLLGLLIVMGQLAFALGSSFYTAPRFEGRIYATIGIRFKAGEDLHKLNEAAHYFGQTIIGWTQFPNFQNSLKNKAGLPSSSTFSAHLQERQNMVFVVQSKEPLKEDLLLKTKDYVQKKLDDYNRVSGTAFILTQLDYENRLLKRGYLSGALIALLASGILWAGWIYFKKYQF